MIFEIIDFYHKKKKTFVATIVIATLMAIVLPATLLFREYKYPQELIKLDSICDVTPNRANELLKLYSSKTKMHGETEWFFRYLTLKSKIKANKNISDDKEVKDLIEHYENKENISLLPEIYYYAGCAYNSLMDIPTANEYFFKGLKSLSNRNDKRLLGLYYYQLGLNFSNQGLHKEALYWEMKSFEISKERKDTARCIYDYMDIAWTYGNLGNPRKALNVMLKARKLAKSSRNEYDLSEIDCQITNHCLELGLLQQAKRHIDYAINEKVSDNSELYSIALETYLKVGDKGKIQEFIDSLMFHGDVYGKRYVYWCLIERCANSNDLGNITKYMKCYKAFSDSAKKITSSESSAKAHALYNYKMREEENMQLHKENTNKNLYIIIVTALFTICILSFYIIYIKVRQQKVSLEKRCMILDEQLKKNQETDINSIRKKQKEIKEIRNKIQKGNQEKYTKTILDTKQLELEKINRQKEHIEYCDEHIKKTESYKQIEDILKGYCKSTFSDWDMLEKTVYNTYPNFKTSLDRLRKLKFMELKVCLLIRIGLNVKDISIITCVSKSSIYSINQRLYYKNFGKYAASSEWIKFIMSIY